MYSIVTHSSPTRLDFPVRYCPVTNSSVTPSSNISAGLPYQAYSTAINNNPQLPRPRRAPHILEVSVTLRKTVQRVITLATRTDEAAQGIGLVLAGVAAVLVDLADGDLHRGVVAGFDNAVGCAALARDVAVRGQIG